MSEFISTHTADEAVIRPGVDQSRREFTHLLDSARSLVENPRARVGLTRLLNARQWPVDPANGCLVHDEARPGCRHCGKVTPDRHDGGSAPCPVCVRDWHQSRAIYARNSAHRRTRGTRDWMVHMAAYDEALRSFDADHPRPEGDCARHEHSTTDTTRASSRRPENPHKVWSVWLADGSELVVVRQVVRSKLSTVRLVDPLDPLADERVVPSTVEVFYIVHCEAVTLNPQIPVVAAEYLGPNSVPLPENVTRWRFLRPVDAYHGPYTSAAEAEADALSWKSNMDDEWYSLQGLRVDHDPTRTDIVYNAWRESLQPELEDGRPLDDEYVNVAEAELDACDRFELAYEASQDELFDATFGQ